jgi:hypothetical protein
MPLASLSSITDEATLRWIDAARPPELDAPIRASVNGT